MKEKVCIFLIKISNWLRRVSINGCIAFYIIVILYDINVKILSTRILQNINICNINKITVIESILFLSLVLSFFSNDKLNSRILMFSYILLSIFAVNETILWLGFTVNKKPNIWISLLIGIAIWIILFVLLKRKLANITEKYENKKQVLLGMIATYAVSVSFFTFISVICFNLKNICLLLIISVFFTILYWIVLNKVLFQISNLQNKNVIFKILTLLNAGQSYLFYFILCICINVYFNFLFSNYGAALLILSISILCVVLSFGQKLFELYGGFSVSLIIIINLIPILLSWFYKGSESFGNLEFPKFIFALILGIGALLLLFVGEEVQTLNGIDISKDKFSALNKKIAKYKIIISNTAILATFVSVILSEKSNINGWVTWLKKTFDTLWLKEILKQLIPFKGKKDISIILLGISLMVMLILIIVIAFILEKLEIKVFKVLIEHNDVKESETDMDDDKTIITIHNQKLIIENKSGKTTTDFNNKNTKIIIKSDKELMCSQKIDDSGEIQIEYQLKDK